MKTPSLGFAFEKKTIGLNELMDGSGRVSKELDW